MQAHLLNRLWTFCRQKVIVLHQGPFSLPYPARLHFPFCCQEGMSEIFLIAENQHLGIICKCGIAPVWIQEHYEEGPPLCVLLRCNGFWNLAFLDRAKPKSVLPLIGVHFVVLQVRIHCHFKSMKYLVTVIQDAQVFSCGWELGCARVHVCVCMMGCMTPCRSCHLTGHNKELSHLKGGCRRWLIFIYDFSTTTKVHKDHKVVSSKV